MWPDSLLGHAMLVSRSGVVPTLVAGSMGLRHQGDAKRCSAQGYEPSTPIPAQLHPGEKWQFSGKGVNSPPSLLALVLREAVHYLFSASQRGLSCLSPGGNPALCG